MQLFIVTGISGSGKTTVARRLSELGYYALDSKLNPGLFHFTDQDGHIPATNHPNDPSWKARHKWVINMPLFEQLTKERPDQAVFLCAGGDSIKVLWPQATKVFLLKTNASTLLQHLNHPSRDNQFAKNAITQRTLLNRLDAFQAKQRAAGAIPIDATLPVEEVVNEILRLATIS
jgi:gluconate kinase